MDVRGGRRGAEDKGPRPPASDPALTRPWAGPPDRPLDGAPLDRHLDRPEEFARFQHQDMERSAKIIADARIQPE